MLMNRLLKNTFIFFTLLSLSMVSMAQIPNCAGADSGFVYLHTAPGIKAFDPTQPLSATNPFVYLASGGGGGLAISYNLNGGTPSPAFYSNVGSMYSYYNGTAWTSTGHAVSTVNPGGGVNFIYSKNGATGEINKYDGTGPATYLTTTYPGSGPYDLAVDAQDNFYHLMTSINPGKIIKYNPMGVAIDSFVVTGHPIQTAGGGFAMIGNDVYAIFNSTPSFYFGTIVAGAVVLSPLGSTPASDMASCPVMANPLPIAAFSVDNDTICAGTCINFTDMTTNSPTSWTWSFPTATPSTSTLQNPSNICFNTPGVHTVQLIAQNGVGADTTSMDIVVDFLGVVSIDGDRELCIGESTTLTANPAGAATYTWSNSSATQVITETPTTTNTYSVVVTNGVCVGTAEATVNVYPLPEVSASATLTGCNNNSGTISTIVNSGTAPYNYAWNNGQSGATAQNLGTGIYTVIVTDSKTCTGSATAEVFMTPNPVATLTPLSATIKYGDTIQLVAGGAKLFHWSPPTYLSSNFIADPLAFPMEDMTYCVVITDENDCKDTICTDIKVEYCDDYFIPNAFSPNGDGKNDRFLIKSKCMTHYSIKIQNRWGETMFESQHSGESWDGTYKGVKQDPGVYFYYAEITFVNGKKKIAKGDLTLIR